MRVIFWLILIGIVFFVVYCLFNVNILMWLVDMLSWGFLVYLIVFVIIFGFVMWYVGISKIGLMKVMVYMYFVLLFVVIFVVVIIGE